MRNIEISSPAPVGEPQHSLLARTTTMDPLWIGSVGYGRWPAADRWGKLVAALRRHEISCLVDVRHDACASNLDPANAYGPRAWHLRAAGGLADGLREHGIAYRWLVELGNPQKRDPVMAVFRRHLDDVSGDWPAQRGLRLLRGLAESGGRIALLCACADYTVCHRSLVVEALARMVEPRRLVHEDVSA